jgi:hypothetical protein
MTMDKTHHNEYKVRSDEPDKNYYSSLSCATDTK